MKNSNFVIWNRSPLFIQKIYRKTPEIFQSFSKIILYALAVALATLFCWVLYICCDIATVICSVYFDMSLFLCSCLQYQQLVTHFSASLKEISSWLQNTPCYKLVFLPMHSFCIYIQRKKRKKIVLTFQNIQKFFQFLRTLLIWIQNIWILRTYKILNLNLR